MKPGMLSHELKEALGMPDGAPPPWLINTQRYGPPPSYPHLKIPGLNAPIPPGASFGYHPGGWGKPPVDEVDLLRGPKSDKVEVTIQPEELEAMDDVLAAKYKEAREEEKLRNQKEYFSDMMENQNCKDRISSSSTSIANLFYQISAYMHLLLNSTSSAQEMLEASAAQGHKASELIKMKDVSKETDIYI
ncbi:uncharacterized protein A4U43_C10F7530 [Asparagus officinalis]|uniref:PSP proline-rich domain-containing protein n=1 Tax=Asparagus officinalis TaxID=4686 RepID=A0A5P1E181_ASPOF|nr:uncharacterized protein A4U43_C10F7530 [Asparagus officinalis]